MARTDTRRGRCAAPTGSLRAAGVRPRHVGLGVAAGALVALVAGCGGGGGYGGGSAPPTSPGQATRVNVSMTEFHLAWPKRTFPPGTYTFVAKNDGHVIHALEIEGPNGEKRTGTVEPGKSARLTVNLKSGTYEVYCPVDGHKDKGMIMKITVSGAASPAKPPTSRGGY